MLDELDSLAQYNPVSPAYTDTSHEAHVHYNVYNLILECVIN